MNKENKHIGLEMKTQHRHIIIILMAFAMALLCCMANGAMAQSVSITAESNDTSRGTVTGTRSCAKGETITLTAKAKEGCGFTFWKKIEGDEETIVSYYETFTFEAKEDGNYKAFFYDNYTGQTSGEYSLSSNLDIEKVDMNGDLTIYMGGSAGCGNRTIKKKAYPGGSEHTFIELRGHKLTLEGRLGDSIVIDGGAVFNTAGDARTLEKNHADAVKISGPMFWLNTGSTLNFKYVVMQNNYVAEGDYYNCGLIKDGYDSSGTPSNFNEFTMTHCAIRGSLATRNGCVINIQDYSKFDIQLSYVKVSKCYSHADWNGSEGGTIRCYAAAKSKLTLDHCEVCYNATGKYGDGAGICWYAKGDANSSLTIKNSKIHHNRAGVRPNGGVYHGEDWPSGDTRGGVGGGISTGAKVSITNTEIYDNYALNEGGGIHVRSGSDFVADLDLSNVKIYDNSSKKSGGGIFFPDYGAFKISGLVKVTGNTGTSSRKDDVYISAEADTKYIQIGNGGLECGSLIGVRNDNGYSDNTLEIARGTAPHCLYAYRNHFFFDDKEESQVFNTNASPFYNNTTGTSLYLVKNATANTALDSWHNQSASSGTDYVLSDGFVSEVKTAAGLAYFSKDVLTKDYEGKTVILSADIDLKDHNWEPIGYLNNCVNNSGKAFKGIFNGQGHIITGIKCPYQYYNIGLFGWVDGGTVKNTLVAASTLSSSSSAVDCLGGLVGYLESGLVYNCAAIATPTGGTSMAGLIGAIASGGSLKNSYAIVSSGNGLAGSNAGTIENCYLSGGATTLVGSGSGTVNYCYTQGGSVSGTNSTFTAATSTFLYRSLDEQVTAVSGNSYIPTRSNKQLVETLNNWVSANPTYAKWGRPTTPTINGDYPVLKMPGSNAVAAASGTPNELHYGSINTLLSGFTGASQAIYLYESAANITSNTSSLAKLYIDPDAAVTQAGDVNAYVGVWLDNTAGSGGAQPSQGGTDAIDWHLFSSALDDLPIGFTYNTSGYTPGYGHTPPKVNFGASKTGYFPINLDDNDTYYSEWDFYSYSELDYHWVNMKRNSDDHWHSDYDFWQIFYDNEDHFVSGRGYLVATAEDCFLQGYGKLMKGDGITHPLSYTAEIAHTTRDGFNVLGNPYQSYLDFDKFATANSAIWKGGIEKSGYIIINEDAPIKGYAYYAYESSANPYGGDKYIHPHQGFIVMACKTGLTATFNEDMRSVTATAPFRGDRPNYPLVNLIVTEASGNCDLCTVELGRPNKGGLVKAKGVKASKGSVYCHYDDEDWAIVFTQPGLSEIGIRFETPEDDTFTITWDTENGDFHYLHLIDNLTGSDIDCLATDEYRFTAKADDYSSRFRLVFGYTGIDEPEENGASTGSETCNFAFMMGNQLVVNGEGTLRLYDVTGRMMMENIVSGTQTVTMLPDVMAGVYVLQLTGSNGSKTQKIVIR